MRISVRMCERKNSRSSFLLNPFSINNFFKTWEYRVKNSELWNTLSTRKCFLIPWKINSDSTGRVKEMKDLPQDDLKMPALFIGHGNPMNAVLDNDFTRALKKIPESIPIPKAIVCVSAHWLTRGTFVNGSPHPKMIYDMYGFP